MAQQVELAEWSRKDRKAMNAWAKHSAPISTRWNIHKPVEGKRHSYAIRVGQTVGRGTLTISADGATAWLGMWIEPGSCSKGIGTEALKLLLDTAFFRLNVLECKLSVCVENERALRLYRSAGFWIYSYEWREQDCERALYADMVLERIRWSMRHASSNTISFRATAIAQHQ